MEEKKEKRVIAIVPVKEVSTRLEDKNFLVLGGSQLWTHSVMYARAEGVEPVVSTDSVAVIAWCERQKVRYVREVVTDGNMTNCVNQVLSAVDCDVFAVLQPTSPIRRPGLLRSLLQAGIATSVYTAERVKLIGHIGGEFMAAGRDQDAGTRWLMHHDGNILVVNADWYRATGKLFCNVSGWVEQKKPYTLQIDEACDFDVVSRVWVNPTP